MKTNDSLSNELLQKAYDALCKKFNLKRFYVSFYAEVGNSRYRYKCCPYLKALTDNDSYVDFATDKSPCAYVQSLMNDLRTSVPECETMKLLLELLGSTSIYLYDKFTDSRKLFLLKGVCLEEILIMTDCLSCLECK